jgi:flagellar protein FlaJ
MTALVYYLPLIAALVAVLPVVLAPVSSRADRLVTRVALTAFGSNVGQGSKRARRKRQLQAAHVATTYRAYAAKTLLLSGLLAVVGSVVGVYLIAALTVLLPVSETVVASVLPPRLSFLATSIAFPELAPFQLFALLLLSSATLGVGAGVLSYQLRWWWPRYVANVRARRIDESLNRTVAFVFALSRSGMAFPAVMRTLTHNRDVYGEAAEEFSVVVKEMDLFGADMLSAMQDVSEQTPSEEFDDFAENLANVLQSGRSVSDFLREQYDRYQEDAKARQEQFLELLGALAEGYVSVLVVGPLLLITILVIVGLMGVADTLDFLQVMAYLLVPLSNVAFIVYLDGVAGTSSPQEAGVDADRATDSTDSIGTGGTVSATDGGTTARAGQVGANVQRLRAYERFRAFRRHADRPLRTILERPTTLLYVTIPLAVVVTLVRLAPHFAGGVPDPAAVDDLFVQALLFVVGTFGIVQEVHKRRLEAIEAAIPDFLDRLAGVNEAGMTIVESLRRVTKGDLGALDEEVERLWADVVWGGDARNALYRFEARVRTATVTRVVTLLTNAMTASGDLGPVLRIAANNAQEARRLKRKRRQEMLVYLLIVYLSFVVFLVIVGALDAILIPNIPTGLESPDATGAVPGAGLPLGGTSDVNVDAYTLLFFHTAVIQGFFSGLVAGQMGEEDVKNGAKHATILVALSYGLFLVLP